MYQFRSLFMTSRSEQRQHLNLSLHARQVIESDMSTFFLEQELSGFICRVIQCFASESDASITRASRKRRDQLERSVLTARYRASHPLDENLDNFDPTATLTDAESRTINSLVDDYIRQTLARMSSYPRDVPMKIRLRNNIYDMVYPADRSDWPEGRYYATVGDYLKAVVEDYASRTFYEREGIICGEVLDALNLELELPLPDRRLLVIETAGRGVSANSFAVKPYAVLPDTGGNYHYLVGMSKRSDAREPYKPVSFRISRILRVRPRPKSYASGKVTQNELKDLKAALKKNGVQYLVGEASISRVNLSADGVKMFNSVLHMRPQPVSTAHLDDGSSILEFDCTEKQLSDYFFKFGSNARILAPDTLAAAFEEKYESALEVYRSNR